MKRKITEELLKWKNRIDHKPLILNGARQVGKSYILEEFGKQYYNNYIRISLDLVPNVRDFLSRNIEPLEIIAYLESMYNIRIIPHETLVILDEIQDCKRALLALKYFREDHPEYDIAAAGSLLGIAVNKGEKKDENEPDKKQEEESFSYPVGKVDELTLYPMDFEEFLWAMGEDKLMDFIRMCFDKKQPVGQSMHRKIMDYFRLYLIVGGMPQAIQEYLDTRSFEDVDRVKRQILNLYHNCIDRYAGKYATKVNSIYEAIPAQLQLHDHKFQLADLDKNARFRNYASAFFWLRDAKMVNLAFNTTEPSIGLGLNQSDNSLKCYMNDTGLMISHAFDERGIVSEQLYQKILKDKLEVNAGMLMENIVGQMLTALGCKLFFYSNSSRENKEDRMEIDFLISKKAITSRHNISPIEVKSSTGFNTISLEKCIKKYGSHLAQAYIVHTGDLEKDGDYLYIPLYMVPCL